MKIQNKQEAAKTAKPFFESFFQKLKLSESNSSYVIYSNKYVILVVFSIYSIITGPVYLNWVPLRQCLYLSGSFAWLCYPDTPFDYSTLEKYDYALCDEQFLKINEFMPILTLAHYFCGFTSGIMLDYIGPKLTGLLGCILIAIGWLIIAISSYTQQYYSLGFIIMALGFEASFLPLLGVSKLFPNRNNLIISFLGTARSFSLSIPFIFNALINLFTIPPLETFRNIIFFYVTLGVGSCVILTILFLPLNKWEYFIKNNNLLNNVELNRLNKYNGDSYKVSSEGKDEMMTTTNRILDSDIKDNQDKKIFNYNHSITNIEEISSVIPRTSFYREENSNDNNINGLHKSTVNDNNSIVSTSPMHSSLNPSILSPSLHAIDIKEHPMKILNIENINNEDFDKQKRKIKEKYNVSFSTTTTREFIDESGSLRVKRANSINKNIFSKYYFLIISFLSDILSLEFAFVSYHMMLFFLRDVYFSSSSEKIIPDVLNLFSLTVLLSFIPAPFIGYLSDKFGIIWIMQFLNFISLLMYVFTTVPNIPSYKSFQSVGSIIYMFVVSFVLSQIYCYGLRYFSEKHFGKLVGFVTMLGGLASLLVNPLLGFSVKMNNFIPVNIAFIVLSVLDIFFLFFLHKRNRKIQKN